MPKDYQPRREFRYQLPHNVYMQVLYIVRDYDRLKAIRNDILHSTPTYCLDRPGRPDDPALTRVLRMAQAGERTDAVDKALQAIPCEYRRPVFNNVALRKAYPATADRMTWSRWRTRFLFYVADHLDMV